MLERNTMQRGSDEFQFRRRALLKTTEPLDLTGETQVSGFVIYGTEPAGTSRRIIFEVDGELFYFTNDGLTKYPSYGEIDDILKYGNTVADLLEVQGIAKWINKKVYPIIALDAPRDSVVMPKIKIGLKVNCFNDEYTREQFSPIFELKHTDNPARIVTASFNKANIGYAKSDVLIRLRDKFGEWGDWLEMANAAGQEAEAVQFKATYTLTALDGTDEAKVFDCKVAYVTDAYNLSGDALEIYTLPQTYYQDLGTCYAMIKHTELLDAEIKAYIKFATLPKQRKNIVIGLGKGTVDTYYLGINGGIDPRINQNTLHLTANGRTITDFYYNTQTATVDLKADSGAEIRASYEYDVDAENWVEMAGELTQPYGDAGLFMSRFIYRLTNSENKRISAVKFILERKSGTSDEEILATATGKTLTFTLPHRAKKESVYCTGNWDYDEETQILTVTGAPDEVIYLSYDWVGIFPQIENVTVGWTPATY